MSVERRRILWHGSRAPEGVMRPTLAGRTEGDGHANSGLGLFCASGPHDYLIGFGTAVFELTLRADVRRQAMPLHDFMEVSHRWREREEFEALGRSWAQQWDVVDLIERQGWHSQSIVLTDRAIENARRYTTEQFLAVAQPRPTEGPGEPSVAIRRPSI